MVEQKQKKYLPSSRVLVGILHFTPSWFSVSMGTGIMSILLHTSPHKFTGETIIGTVFYFINILLFITFLGLTLLRYIIFPWAFLRMLRHSSQSLFLGTIPMALATIVNATVIIVVPKYGQWARDLSWALWWIDVSLTLLSVFGIPIIMFQVHTLTLDTMTGAWLLPIVPAVVCAASGGLVATVLNVKHAQITIFVSYVLWGVGMTLSILVMALYFHRLAVHKLPNAEVIVSALLPLGPCGQGTFGIVQLAKASIVAFKNTDIAGIPKAADIVLVISIIVGLMTWGLGLWWLVHGLACVSLKAYSSRLRLNMGFWGFIFPLGVFVAGTISLGETIPSAFMSYLSIVLLCFLAMLYVAVSIGTVHGAYNRTLLVAPCMTDLEECPSSV